MGVVCDNRHVFKNGKVEKTTKFEEFIRDGNSLHYTRWI